MGGPLRTRWAAVGAAVAVTLGAGGASLGGAAVSTGEKPVVITVDTARILDTRIGVGLTGGRFVDSTPRELQVTGPVPVAPVGTATVVPAGAVGVLVNVTVVAPDNKGFLSLRSGDATGAPSTSTVNFEAGITTPNAATVDLSADGEIQIWLETGVDGGSAHVLLDVVGYTVDHRHDDRYYTEGEIDAALDGKSDVGHLHDNRYYTETEVAAIVDGLRAAQPFAVASFSTANISLTSGLQLIASVQITAPVDGHVTVNSSGYPVVDAPNGVSCQIGDGSTVSTAEWFQPGTGSSNGNVSGTGMFEIEAGQTRTYEYRCFSPQNAGFIGDPSGITAVFTPAP